MEKADAVELTTFVAEVRPRLTRAFAAAYGVERAQEALSEAMAYAAGHFEELRTMRNPAGYLYRVGQSRSRPRKTLPHFPDVVAAGVADIEPGLPRALALLTERQRVCVVLVHAYDWTHAEVANLLGLSRSSVQNHVERGLAGLREAIGVTDE